MAENDATWVETLLKRIGTASPGQRLALSSSELVRTNGDHTLFFANKIDELVLRPHLAVLREIVGTPVKLEYRAKAAPASATQAAAPEHTDPRRKLPQDNADTVDYDALRATFSRSPFQIFDNVRGATDILNRAVAAFPEPMPEKQRPYALVGGVGIGKTSTIESVVYALETRRRRAIAAYQEPNYHAGLALARAVAGEAESETALWERVRALATSRICYESAQRIKDDYKEIGELANHGKKDLADARAAKFHGRHKNLDLWVIDDIQLLSIGKPTMTLEWLFGKLNELYEQRKPVIITSDKSPAHFENFPEHTRTRLSENICTITQPTERDKQAYATLKFAELKAAGIDLSDYATDWMPTVVRMADHYRHINAIFNNITNNSNGQQSLFNPAQLFEQALDVIGKDSQTARGTYAVRKLIGTVVSLAGITEKDLKTSEAEMRRAKSVTEFLTKRTALVIAAKTTGLDYADLGLFLGYNGITNKQRTAMVESALKECGNIYVDDQPAERQFHRVYEAVRENLENKGYPLFGKK